MTDHASSLAARDRALFETTPDGILILDDDGIYVDANEAMARMIGGTRDDLIGRHFRELIPPGREEEAERAFGRLQSGTAVSLEFPIRSLDGTVTNLEWRSRANFVPGLHLCIARDLSTRDAAQRALRESEERYRAFVANSTEAIWRFELEEPVPADLDSEEQIDRYYRFGYLAECNEAMARMYGFGSSSDLVGARLGDLLVREDPKNVEYLRAFIDSGYLLTGAESVEQDRDGNEKHFVNNLIGVLENGRVVRAWGTQRDITERARMIERLAFLAEVSAVFGSSLDYDATLRSIAETAVPRFADSCAIDMATTETGGGDAYTLVVPLVGHGRTLGTLTFSNEESRRRFSDEDVRFAEDLGRRAGLAVDNARLYQELARANRAKDEFLAMLSHELRTPMTATLGWAAMLQSGALPEEGVRTGIDAIAQSTRAQARLIDDLLDISRIVSGKMQLTPMTVRLADTIVAAIDTVRPAAEAKQIALQLELHGEEIRLTGDAARLQQVFWNLLSNAVKFSPRFGRVTVALTSDGGFARVVVRDYGEGIDRELLPFIFDRFRQGESGATRRFGGLGLGLSIARNLVELHGGTLSAASEGAGKGAEFTVALPLSEARESAAPQPAATLAPLLAGLRLLLVEDDDSTRMMLQLALRQFGADVSAAACASEAFEVLSKDRFDVVVSDIGMPGEDGCALMQRVRAANNGVSAIALSAYANEGERDRALSAGFQAWLAKPVDPAVLAEKVRSLSERSYEVLR